MKPYLISMCTGFFLLISSVLVNGQENPSQCTIRVETVLTQPVKGKDGKIEFKFEDKRTYKIFLVNQGADTAKDPLKATVVSNLKAGFYDFVIIDDKGCTKQLTLTLK